MGVEDIKPCLLTTQVNMSRYPSAYGHTPSYRSYTSSTSSGPPSYLASPPEYGGLGSSRGRSSSLLKDQFRKEFSSYENREIDAALHSDFQKELSSFSRNIRDRSMIDSDFEHE